MRSSLDNSPSLSAAVRTWSPGFLSRKWCSLLLALAIIALPEGRLSGEQAQADQSPATVAVVDGGVGRCAVEFTVTDPASKPVYAAQIDVHVAYGFMGLHKLDLTVYTNSEGKAKFAGLPSKVAKPPLAFHASKENLTGVAAYNPATECQAKHDIVLRKP